MIAAIAMPLLLSVPLNSDHRDSTVVIVHEHQAHTAPEGLNAVRGFTADGRAGFIGAAQTSGKKWGFINERGQWIVAPTLDDARTFSADGLARFQQDGRWGYLNTAGAAAIPVQFDDARAFEQGLAAVQVGNGQWRFIDRTGKFAFEKTFFAAGSFSAAVLAPAVESGSKRLSGYIDRSGQWVIKPRFKTSLAFGADGVAPASIDQRKFGLIDRKGNWVLEPTYPDIHEFNDEGLAYFDEENSWTNGHGYLNAKGKVAFKGGGRLSSHMAGGVVYAGGASDGYLTKGGQPLPAPRLSWAGHFNEFGYAVVRTADFIWSETLQRHQDASAEWGILRVDGSFKAAPAEALEPLTNAEGWIPAPLAGTPLTPFLTRTGQIVFLDRDGVITYRIHYERNRAALLDAKGALLWQSDTREACRAPAPFFQRTIDSYLDRLDSIDHVVSSAESMLVETEEKLHRFAAGESLAKPVREETDEDEDEDEDEEDAQTQEENSLVTVRRLVRAYVSEEHNGQYDFLGRLQEKTVDAAKDTLLKPLIAHYGAPDPDPEHASSRHRHVLIMSAWPIKLQKSMTGAAGPFPEVNQLWLGLYGHADSGDGDEWDELWLMCAPSIDALEAAKRVRSKGIAPRGLFPAEAPSSDGDASPRHRPQTYDEWVAAAREEKSAIGAVPAELVDDAMVDAAVEANVEALEYVPAPWQTPARLKALIRKDAATASCIPPKCMTAEALTLARSLYAKDSDWQWRDEQNSQLPAEWTKNCLYNVWGGLLSESHCLRAVSGGEGLDEIPHWLRTTRVEQAALEADIYNISYIPKERITPKLAARAVRHDYGKLIEHIPTALLTPDLCLVSARTNGLSLEHIPAAMRSIDVCVAALRENSSVFPFVPDEIRLAVSSRLIQEDLKSAREKGEERVASRWHAYRAWLKLKLADHTGAIDDAKLAVERLRYPQTAHYILASAYQALGRRSEAALEASTVLSLEDPYQAEYDNAEDTSWLKALTKGQFDSVDGATLIAQLKASPRALADVPRDRITHEMVAVALAGDPGAIEFVPKRLMTAERYVIALRTRAKAFENIPAQMVTEDTYVELVRENGHALGRVPHESRTVKVCAHALRDTARALEYIPEPIRQAAQDAAKALPGEED